MKKKILRVGQRWTAIPSGSAGIPPAPETCRDEATDRRERPDTIVNPPLKREKPNLRERDIPLVPRPDTDSLTWLGLKPPKPVNPAPPRPTPSLSDNNKDALRVRSEWGLGR